MLVAAALVSVSSAAGADAGEVTRVTLDNGLRVVVVRDPLAPVVTTEMNYLVGSIDEPDGAPGLAHAQEHMLFRSSQGLSADQLALVGAGMGGNANADTQQSVTQFMYTVPADDLDVALRIEATRMRGALDSDDEWAQERGAIEQEVATKRVSPLYRARAEALRRVYAGTPYTHDALGTAASFENINGAALRNFYDLWYAPNNAILVIAGDVDAAKAIPLAQQMFGSIQKRPLPRRGNFDLLPMTASQVLETTGLPWSLAFVAYRLPGFADHDYAAGRVLADVLASRRAGIYRLQSQGKALGAGFISDSLPKASLGIAYVAVDPSRDPAQAAETLKAILAGYVRDGLPADLIEAAKKKEIAEAQFKRNSISELAQEWSQALAVEGRTSPDDDVDAISAVTVADVNRVAARSLDDSTAVVAVLQRARYGGRQYQEGGEGESFSRNPTARVLVPSWAAKVFTSLRPASSAVSPSDMTLANGLRLVVQHESVTPTVTLVGQIGTNPYIESPPGKDGVAQMLDELFAYGTTSRDQSAYQQAQDDISASVTGGSTFALSVSAANFDRGVELLADNLLHPALPESAFVAIQSQVVGVLGVAGDNPGISAYQLLVTSLFPPGDPVLRRPSVKSIRNLTLADVRGYYQRAFRPDVTTIAVIGDVSPEQARATIEKWFGGWQTSGPKPRTELPPVPLNKGRLAVLQTTGLQDRVTAAETLALTRRNPDYYALQVGNYIYGHQSFAARLFRDLRIDRGLVYYVDGSFDVGRTRSTYRVTYACDPRNLMESESIVRRDLLAMQTSLVGAQELERAKAMLEREIPLAESSEDAIAHALVDRASSGLPLDEPQVAARRYLQVTAEDVRTAFAKWLSVGRLVEVVEGPLAR